MNEICEKTLLGSHTTSRATQNFLMQSIFPGRSFSKTLAERCKHFSRASFASACIFRVQLLQAFLDGASLFSLPTFSCISRRCKRKLYMVGGGYNSPKTLASLATWRESVLRLLQTTVKMRNSIFLNVSTKCQECGKIDQTRWISCIGRISGRHTDFGQKQYTLCWKKSLITCHGQQGGAVLCLQSRKFLFSFAFLPLEVITR